MLEIHLTDFKDDHWELIWAGVTYTNNRPWKKPLTVGYWHVYGPMPDYESIPLPIFTEWFEDPNLNSCAQI